MSIPKLERIVLDVPRHEKENVETVARERGLTTKAFLIQSYEKELSRVPLVGTIPCSPSQAADELVWAPDDQQMLSVGDLFQVVQGKHYFVQARGDSMTGDGILQGDWVLIERTINGESPLHFSNDVWVVLILREMTGWEVTLKRVRRGREGHLVLCPTNPNFEEEEVPADVEKIRFCGIMKGLVRRR